MRFKRLADLDLKGRRVFIRSDLNVPMDDTARSPTTRGSGPRVPAIRHCLEQGAAVMVTSHLGRPEEGKLTAEDSLAPVAARLRRTPGQAGAPAAGLGRGRLRLAPGEVVMLENCRGNPGEKKDDEGLARQMAALCDVYVNDAFGTAHRAEATTHGWPASRRWPVPARCWRPNWTRSARPSASRRSRWSPSSPARRCRPSSPSWRRLPARSTSSSSVAASPTPSCWRPACRSASPWRSPDWWARPGRSSSMMRQRGAAVPIPVDVVCATKFAADAQPVVKAAKDVGEDDLILDIGPKTSDQLRSDPRGGGHHRLERAGRRIRVRLVRPGHRGTGAGNRRVAAGFRLRAAATRWPRSPSSASPAEIDYISTGGGAFLEFLEGKTLPAVAALEARA